jgi:predicted nucleotidyltransferase
MDKEQLIDCLRKSKEKLVKEKNVELVILFGSYAEGRAKKDSDVDLIIVGKEFMGKKYGRARGLRKYFDINLPLDLLCYTPKEFAEKTKGITIVREALKHGIEV